MDRWKSRCLSLITIQLLYFGDPGAMDVRHLVKGWGGGVLLVFLDEEFGAGWARVVASLVVGSEAKGHLAQ